MEFRVQCPLVMESCNAVLQASKAGRITHDDAEGALEVMLSLLQSNIKTHAEEDLVRTSFDTASNHVLRSMTPSIWRLPRN